MNKLLRYPLLALVALALGCSKDKTPEPALIGCNWTRFITETGGSPDLNRQELVTRDNKSRIIRINLQVPGSPDDGQETAFDHNAENQVDRIYVRNDEGQVIRRFELEYGPTGNLIRKKDFEYYTPGGNYFSANDWSLEYNNKKQLTRRRKHEPYFSNYTDFVYNEAGNVEKELSYRGVFPGPAPALVSSREYEYDNRPAFHSRHYLVYSEALSSSKNNVTKITSKDGNGVVIADQSYMFTYTYNPSGHPTVIHKATFANPGTVTVSRVEYDCR